jgi:hypothetical protein
MPVSTRHTTRSSSRRETSTLSTANIVRGSRRKKVSLFDRFVFLTSRADLQVRRQAVNYSRRQWKSGSSRRKNTIRMHLQGIPHSCPLVKVWIHQETSVRDPLNRQECSIVQRSPLSPNFNDQRLNLARKKKQFKGWSIPLRQESKQLGRVAVEEVQLVTRTYPAAPSTP